MFTSSSQRPISTAISLAITPVTILCPKTPEDFSFSRERITAAFDV